MSRWACLLVAEDTARGDYVRSGLVCEASDTLPLVPYEGLGWGELAGGTKVVRWDFGSTLGERLIGYIEGMSRLNGR